MQKFEDMTPCVIRRMARFQLLCQLRDCGFFKAKKKEHVIYDQAVINLLMSSEKAMHSFLSSRFDYIRFRNYERNKEGQLVSVEAYLADK